jgi:hypothetical protein
MADNAVTTTESTRRNIVMDDETRRKAEMLEAVEMRSFSNLLAVLVTREFDRQGLKLEAQAAEEGKAVVA